MATFIVTGPNGQVGSHLIPHLLMMGDEVVGLGRRATDFSHPKYSHIVDELSDAEHIAKVLSSKEIDAIIHLAWAGSAGIERGDLAIQKANVQMTLEMAKLALLLKAKFVGVGTISESEIFLDTVDTNGLAYIYGSAKDEARRATLELLQKATPQAETINGSYSWIRLGNTYGGDDPHTSDRFIYGILRDCIAGKDLSLSTMDQWYDFVHIEDAINGIREVGLRGTSLLPYYVGSGRPQPMRSYIEEVHRVVESSSVLTFDRPYGGSRLPKSAFSTKQLENDTNFRAQKDFGTEMGLIGSELRT